MKKLCSFILFLFIASFCYGAEEVDVVSLAISHKTTVVTLSTTATLLPATALSGRKVISVQNIGGGTIYLGNDSVTADTTIAGGWQLKNTGDSWTGDFTDEILLYGIVANGTLNAVVWEAR